MINFRNLTVLAAILIIASCSNKEKREALLPNVTGKAGEIVLVINKEMEAGATGQLFDTIFGQAQIGLPQDEPLFDLITVPPAAFRNVFERHRNIVNLSVKPANKTAEMLIKEDAWAHPQMYVSLQAPNNAALIKLVDSVQDNLLKLFMQTDRERTQEHYLKYRNITVSNKLKKYYGIDMIVPKGYIIDEADSSFMWMTHETRDLSQGIIVYTQTYSDTSQLTRDGILSYRDTLFKRRVPGPRTDTYMQTENRMYAPLSRTHKLIGGKYTSEIRGLWRVENDFMGGPFLSYTFLDDSKNRLISLYAYVYAPRNKKRNYLRQLETILRTCTLTEKAQ